MSLEFFCDCLMNSKLCFQLLVDAVLFGVIPIVYEYEGTTSEALMMKLEKTLAGRTARCDFPKKNLLGFVVYLSVTDFLLTYYFLHVLLIKNYVVKQI